MGKQGLCGTCAQVTACIFVKDLPVWFCEEFSNDSNALTSLKQGKIKKVISSEVAIESE